MVHYSNSTNFQYQANTGILHEMFQYQTNTGDTDTTSRYMNLASYQFYYRLVLREVTFIYKLMGFFCFQSHFLVSAVYWILIFPLVIRLVHVLLTRPQCLRSPRLFNGVNAAHLWCSVFVHLNFCLSLFLFTFCPCGCLSEIAIFVLRPLIF